MEYTLMHKNVEVTELLLDDESCYILKVDKLNAPEHLRSESDIQKASLKETNLTCGGRAVLFLQVVQVFVTHLKYLTFQLPVLC